MMKSKEAEDRLKRYPWHREAMEARRALAESGYLSCFVGGVVRDVLLGRAIHDYDLATSATPEEVAEIFPCDRLLPTGLQHGTYTLRGKSLSIEITSFRRESTYSDRRHPDQVRFTRSLAEDLSRRDFSINAMAWSPETALVDLSGGLRDLEEGRIKTVGAAERRFAEDVLRILRALRLAAELGFRLDTETAQACRAQAVFLPAIPGERLSAELIRALSAEYAPLAFTEYADVWSAFLPISLRCRSVEKSLLTGGDRRRGAKAFNETRWKERSLLLSDLPLCAELRLLWLLEAAPVEQLEVLRLSSAFYRFYQKLAVLCPWRIPPSEAGRKKLLGHLGREFYPYLLRLAQLGGMITDEEEKAFLSEQEGWLSEAVCLRLHDLAVDGHDLIRLGFRPGKELGRQLDFLLDEVLSGRLANDASSLLAAVKIKKT